MKYLLVLLVLVIAIHLWRKRGRAENLMAGRERAAQERHLQAPQDMVACAHCGLHLPLSDALPSADSETHYYCCELHRALGPECSSTKRP